MLKVTKVRLEIHNGLTFDFETKKILLKFGKTVIKQFVKFGCY